ALVGIAVGCARGPGVGGEAGGGVAFPAHRAETAANVRGDDDAVSFLDVLDSRADFFDDTERLMADDSAFDAAHAAFIKVEVSAADGSGSDAQQHVGSVLHLSVGNFAHRNLACLFEDDGFHRQLLSPRTFQIDRRCVETSGDVIEEVPNNSKNNCRTLFSVAQPRVGY